MRREPSESGSAALRRYVVAALPGWLLVLVAAVLLSRRLGAPPAAWIALVLVWIAVDLARFPWMRRYYESAPAATRIVGESGRALTPLAPSGFARVHGELWQVRVADGAGAIPEGATVRVREIDGLVLLVEPAAGPAPGPPGQRDPGLS